MALETAHHVPTRDQCLIAARPQAVPHPLCCTCRLKNEAGVTRKLLQEYTKQAISGQQVGDGQ